MKKKISYLVSGALMMVLSLGVSKSTTTAVQGGCDIECYCSSLFMIMSNPDNGFEAMELAANAWNLFNCPTGNPSQQ